MLYKICTQHFIGCVHAKLLQLYPALCSSMDHSPPGSSVHRILQARILKWVAMPFSRGSSRPTQELNGVSYVSCAGGEFFPTKPPGKPISFGTFSQGVSNSKYVRYLGRAFRRDIFGQRPFLVPKKKKIRFHLTIRPRTYL